VLVTTEYASASPLFVSQLCIKGQREEEKRKIEVQSALLGTD
jgi:hypothetical protein